MLSGVCVGAALARLFYGCGKLKSGIRNGLKNRKVTSLSIQRRRTMFSGM